LVLAPIGCLKANVLDGGSHNKPEGFKSGLVNQDELVHRKVAGVDKGVGSDVESGQGIFRNVGKFLLVSHIAPPPFLSRGPGGTQDPRLCGSPDYHTASDARPGSKEAEIPQAFTVRGRRCTKATEGTHRWSGCPPMEGSRMRLPRLYRQANRTTIGQVRTGRQPFGPGWPCLDRHLATHRSAENPGWRGWTSREACDGRLEHILA
jgi:hypothetical protein